MKNDPLRVRLKRYFISGLIIFLPLSLTIYFFVIVVNLADGFLGRFIKPYFAMEFGFYVRGLSIVIGAMVIFLIGFFATNFFGRRAYSAFERFLLRLPFFRQIYPPIKEMAIFLFSRDNLSFQQVVLVEFPRKGLYTIGFLTGDTPHKISQKAHQELLNVLIPNVPNPLSGFLILVPKSEITYLDITTEEAIKLIVSGGVVNPT